MNLVEMFLSGIVSKVIDVVYSKVYKEDQNGGNGQYLDGWKKVELEDSIKKVLVEQTNKLESNGKADFLSDLRKSFVYRIYDVFGLYNIPIEKAPLFFKGFNIEHKDMYYEDKIIEKFNTDVIKYLASILKINEDWIYGKSDRMILFFDKEFYKSSGFFSKKLFDTYPSKVYILSEKIPNKIIDEEKDGNYFGSRLASPFP